MEQMGVRPIHAVIMKKGEPPNLSTGKFSLLYVGSYHVKHSYELFLAATFIPMPVPKTTRRTSLYNKWLRYDVCRTPLY